MRFVEANGWFLKEGITAEFPLELSELPAEAVEKLPIMINLEAIAIFNPSSNPYRCTISFITGERVQVEIAYDDLKALVLDKPSLNL